MQNAPTLCPGRGPTPAGVQRGTSGTTTFGVPATTVRFCSFCPTPAHSDATIFFAPANCFTPNHLFPFLLQETTHSENIYRPYMFWADAQIRNTYVVKVLLGARVSKNIVMARRARCSRPTPCHYRTLRPWARVTRELDVFAHIRSPVRIHFEYTDISSLPRSVYPLYFLRHRVARVVSICLSLCVRLHLVLEHQHSLSFE